MRRRPASIKWYHEIFRKYAEGVTGLKPRVKRSGTLGTEYECFQGTTGGSMSINRVGRAGSPRGANPRAIQPPVGGFPPESGAVIAGRVSVTTP